jgi:uncharacterized protein YndB with AHSA1/START domain
MTETTFVYVTYIAAAPEKLWEALTSGEFTVKYFFGQEVQSDWREGSSVVYLMENGAAAVNGKVLKCYPPNLLSFTWDVEGDETPRDRPTKVTFMLKPIGKTVKLTLKHEDLLPRDISERDDTLFGANNGWPVILSRLKSLIETGSALPDINYN